jgi:hypothetical protein
MSTVTPFLCSSFQLRMFAFLWVLERSPTPPTSFSQQRLKKTEIQLLPHSLATPTCAAYNITARVAQKTPFLYYAVVAFVCIEVPM